MTDITLVQNALTEAKSNYEHAVARNGNISSAKEQYKNIMFNCREEILGAVKLIEECRKKEEVLQEEIAVLQKALEEADKENDELRKSQKAKNEKRSPKE